MKQKDIDTVVFFTIFYRYYFNQNNTRYIPQAQICRLLNLFAHTQDPLKRINTHFAKYCKEENIESLAEIFETNEDFSVEKMIITLIN